MNIYDQMMTYIDFMESLVSTLPESMRRMAMQFVLRSLREMTYAECGEEYLDVKSERDH